MRDIGVLGGGVSGLSFASFVKNSEVLEKEMVPGGIARTLTHKGYLFDLGSHIIFSRNKKVLDFMFSVLGRNIVKHKRNAKIMYKGRLVKYPFENELSALPFPEGIKCAFYYSLAHLRSNIANPGKPANFAEWMHRQFGKGITEKYLYPYNKKIWNTSPEEMASFWVEGRVPKPPVADVLKSALGIPSEGYLHQRHFYYPRKGGYQALANSLAKKLGKRLLLSHEISGVKKEENFVLEFKNSGHREYKDLVSTIHILDFLRMYRGTPKEVLEAAEKLRWNSAYFVLIGLKKPKINNLHWIYLPEEEVFPNRISFPSNYSPSMAPKGHSSLLAEITFHPSEKITRANPEKIKQKTIEQLSSLGFFRQEDISFSKIVSIPYAYVVYTKDYQENISVVHKFAKQEGITLLGRFSEFAYYNADKCIARAMECAKVFSS